MSNIYPWGKITGIQTGILNKEIAKHFADDLTSRVTLFLYENKIITTDNSDDLLEQKIYNVLLEHNFQFNKIKD